MARRGRTPVLRTSERDRCLECQEGQSAEHDPPDGEARRAGSASHTVLLAAWRERVGSLWGLGLNADCRGADRPEGIPDGTGPAVLRCDRAAVGEVHRAEGRENDWIHNMMRPVDNHTDI